MYVGLHIHISPLFGFSPKGSKEVALEEKETALTKEQARFDSLLQEIDVTATTTTKDLEEQELIRQEKENAVSDLTQQLSIIELKLKEDNV